MRRVALLCIVAVIASTAACKRGEEPPPPQSAKPAPARDPHSRSNPDEIAVTHLDLRLGVDFAAKVLTGVARLTLERRGPADRPLVLDTNGLAIDAVAACEGGRALTFELGSPHERLGRALTISAPGTCVEIRYRSAPEAKALLWVEPAATAGKQQPMLFTQSQSILARTWIPLQDTPGVRMTYSAAITVPPGVRPVMSAENPTGPGPDGAWHFDMKQAIPSYLLALAVGDYAFRELGKRTGVYAEPSVLDAAAHEFAEVEQMMEAGETLYGAYRWGRYDVLVLPASFPFGGMENPRLTFLTPTVIVGDRSLVGLIAHELAHSWSGNLVTNSTWNDVWLNEGFTTYVERRIMEALRGKEVADVSWALGRQDLDATLAQAAQEHLDTRLALTFGPDEDTENAPSDVAYEKGALLLRAMELEFGRDVFDRWMRERFDRLAFKSTDSKAFELDASQALFATKRTTWTLGEWLHQNGLPKSAPASTSARVSARRAEAAAFVASGALPDASTWKTTEWISFLRGLPKGTTQDKLLALDEKFALTGTTNAMIAMYWLPLLVDADVQTAAPAVEGYLLRVGRRWLVSTVYEALVAKNEFWRGVAARAFEKAKTGYHPVTRDSITELLAGKKKSG